MQTLEPLPKIVDRLAASSPKPAADRSREDGNDPRWQLAQRIAASGSLGRSRLLADFLLYVVDRHIRDRGDEITEQQIGVLVFGRSEGYDSNEDNIVRSYARNLRKRIDEYFATEGRNEDLRLEIPRGGYIPIFSTRAVEAEAVSNLLVARTHGDGTAGDNHIAPESPQAIQSAASEQCNEQPSLLAGEPEPSAKARWLARGKTILRKHRPLSAICLGIAVGVGCTVLHPLNLLKRVGASSAEAASANLWTQIFNSERDTFIVPSDDGLIIMQGLTERPIQLASYVNGSYRTNLKSDGVPGAPEIIKLGARRYTSVVDLDFVAHLAQLDEVVPERMMIRYARDLRMDDLRSGNAILIGSDEANPWIELFGSQMNFRFSINAGNDKPSGIVNVHPQAGENSIYGTGLDHTYGVIAYLPNLTSTGHVLIVGGLNTAGTQAATTFLLNPSLMMPTLQRARLAHGGLQSFELLIGASNVAANASTPHAILERISLP